MNIRFGLTRVAVLRLKMPCVAPMVALGVFLAMMQPPALAQAQRFFYRFTTIADTQQGFPFSDPLANGFGYPCQNNEKGIAFEGNLANITNTDGMFFSIGPGHYVDIADTNSQQYTGFGPDCSINANGLVLFTGYQQETTLLLLGGRGTQVQTLLGNGGKYPYFSRFQLNSQGKAAVLASTSDSDSSGSVVLTKVAGGSEKIIATTSPGSPYISFGAVSINSTGTVAFTAGRPDGSQGIFTVSESGITQVLADSNSGPIANFFDLALNDKGSAAVDGLDQNGNPGVWRIDNNEGGNPPVVTKITDAGVVGAYEFTGVSINNSGQVAYSFRDPSMMYSYVGSGNGGLSLLNPIVVQPYTYVLGRFVGQGFITQDSLNNLGQIAVSIQFESNPPSSVVALAEIVDAQPNPLPPPPVTEIGLSTGTGSSAGVHTTVNLPPQLLELAFDATFMTKQGNLKVTLGDKLLKTVPASALGVRQSFRIPINMRRKGRSAALPGLQDLKFQLTGTAETVVQIGNIRIPAAGLRWNPRQKNSRWQFDTQGGGWGGLVDATRFPVEIKVLSLEPRETSTPTHAVSVAILSTKSFDATKDIERATLYFAGMPVRSERDAKGSERPKCVERDVNGDQHPDLVCEFEAPAAPAGDAAQKRIRRLEGMTPYGWSVEGQAD